MKLTCVTAVFNAIKSGNRENLIRCVRSVAALKTEHEHLIYDGGSTDGTVELLRELEKKIGGENRWTEDGLRSSVDAFVSNASDGSACSSTDAIGTIASTVGGESGALIERALPENDNSATSHFSLLTSRSTLRVVSEPDTGIYNALNKGVRDAKGEWFYVLGCDDYITNPSQVDALIQNEADGTELIIAPVEYEGTYPLYGKLDDLSCLLLRFPYSHQSVIMRTVLLRSFGGFDESFKICADWNMLMQCHEQARCFHYTFVPIAHYSVGGASEHGDFGEQHLIHRRHLGLSESEMKKVEQEEIIPLRVLWRYLRHPDLALRMSARKFAGAYFFNLLRLTLWPVVILRRRIRRSMRSA